LLLTGGRESALEISFRFRDVVFRRLERDFASNSIDLGLEPPFPASVNRGQRLANAPGIIELAEFRVGFGQI
jgi:hypothetical protein